MFVKLPSIAGEEQKPNKKKSAIQTLKENIVTMKNELAKINERKATLEKEIMNSEEKLKNLPR